MKEAEKPSSFDVSFRPNLRLVMERSSSSTVSFDLRFDFMLRVCSNLKITSSDRLTIVQNSSTVLIRGGTLKNNKEAGSIDSPVVETLHAPPHGTTAAPETAKVAKAKRGEGVTITVDFKDHLDLLESIKTWAKGDDREPSKWLRRRLIQLEEAGMLFESDEPEYVKAKL
jgi:hypothetical protein